MGVRAVRNSLVLLAGPRRVSSDGRRRTRRANPVVALWLFLGLVQRRRAAAQPTRTRGDAAGQALMTSLRGRRRGPARHGEPTAVVTAARSVAIPDAGATDATGAPGRPGIPAEGSLCAWEGRSSWWWSTTTPSFNAADPPRVVDGVLLVRRSLCKVARCLECAETGPEEDNGNKEGNQTTRHAIHCGERGNCPTLEARSSHQRHRGCRSKWM